MNQNKANQLDELTQIGAAVDSPINSEAQGSEYIVRTSDLR